MLITVTHPPARRPGQKAHITDTSAPVRLRSWRAVAMVVGGVLAAMANSGCVGVATDPGPPPGASSASGGVSGQQLAGTGGAVGSGGAVDATGGAGPGNGSATGGTPGTGGLQGTGGLGSGGVTGSGGTTGAGGTVAGAGGSTAPTSTAPTSTAPTFTQIYQTILSVSCVGSQCHNPGTQGGVSFASRSSAYAAVSARVIPGDAAGSTFYSLLSSGRMPLNGPKLSSAQLSGIAAWINAGALND